MSVNWVACGTNYTKTELVVIELQCSNRLFFCFCFVCFFFFGRGGGGGSRRPFEGSPIQPTSSGPLAHTVIR